MILFYRKHQSNILSSISRVTKKQEQFNNCKILPKNIEEVSKTKINIKTQNNNSFNYTTKKDSISDSHRILFKDILSVNDKRKENKENSFNAKNTNILKTNNEETNKDDFKDLNDEEINSLPYGEALIVDKRNFLQYYWSLISRKNLILFSFIPMNDYNLIYIKICIFIISFSLYITVNALFFTDETMHKIYKDKGIFNFIFQLPKIIYSTIISSVINILIKFFALSEKNILKLKQNIKKVKGKDIKEEVNKTITFLNIKFLIFFIIGIIFLFIFWYYVAVFCAVYKNTQITLIKDSVTSFSFSLIYPFLLNYIPALLRIISIKNKDNRYLYKFSKIFAYLI